MTITVPPKLEEIIQQELASGKYDSEDQVIAEALRLLQQRECKLNALKEDIQIGIKQLDNGEGGPLDMASIKEEISKKLAE
ncbi:MAG: type II toxin-antitoxin system ParD family antitoxin [Planctomycetota bacterium]|jgi:antitoxin ParD1/3/4|nr:type II toxin-antitoxin system ParD family antitoxin [Planctomycetota bacterium]MDP6502097.1 type II toxin-antitoxin system ParD family antitoxin [Planctomycetota bacterium]